MWHRGRVDQTVAVPGLSGAMRAAALSLPPLLENPPLRRRLLNKAGISACKRRSGACQSHAAQGHAKPHPSSSSVAPAHLQASLIKLNTTPPFVARRPVVQSSLDARTAPRLACWSTSRRGRTGQYWQRETAKPRLASANRVLDTGLFISKHAPLAVHASMGFISFPALSTATCCISACR